jgi:Recombination endonuclease VII
MPSKYKRPPSLTSQQQRELRELQAGMCPLCGHPWTDAPSMTPQAVEVEHSHRTGLLRGLVHRECNQFLRTYGDSPKAIREEIVRLRRALRYLRNPPAKSMKKEAE